MQAANKVALNTGFLYARMGITVFISLYATRLILSALGTTDFGIFNVVGGAIAMFGFLNASMAAASQRFMSYAKGANKKDTLLKIFNISFLLHIVISIAVLIVLEIFGPILLNHILKIPAERLAAAEYIYHFFCVKHYIHCFICSL